MTTEKLELLKTLVSQIDTVNSEGVKTLKESDELLERFTSSLTILYLNASATEHRYIELLDAIKGPQEFEGEYLTPLSSFWAFADTCLERMLGYKPTEDQLLEYRSEIMETDCMLYDRAKEFYGR